MATFVVGTFRTWRDARLEFAVQTKADLTGVEGRALKLDFRKVERYCLATSHLRKFICGQFAPPATGTTRPALWLVAGIRRD